MSFFGTLFANNRYKSLSSSDSEPAADSYTSPQPQDNTTTSQPYELIPDLLVLLDRNPRPIRLSTPKPLCSIFTTAVHADADLLPSVEKLHGDTYQLPKPDNIFRIIIQHQTQGHNIILMGDFNEHVRNHNSFLQQVCLQCHLKDIWKQRSPILPEPSTYLRGSTCIDYVLISQGLSHTISAIGYEPFHHTTPTDHRGVYIDFYTDQLFGNAHNPLLAAQFRQLQSKYP
jgi:hypothetical protein